MKILILGALEKEITILATLIKAEAKGHFYFAKTNDNDIYIALTGVGILSASVSTYSLIDEINPDIIINIGTAGGHTLEVKEGDIIICDEAIYHGGYIMKDEPASWKTIEDTDLVIKGDEKLSKLIDEINDDASIYHGATLSGDFFTKDKDIIKALNSKYHHLCEDMETIAVYKVAKGKKIPTIAIRIISNNELRGTLYQDHVYIVNEKLQRFIVELLHYLN